MIDALSRQQHHVPYRDSNLTYLLKNSLGGDAKTFMLATISPSSTVIDETINTLRYAGLASTITNVPRIKTPHLRHEIDELREENARLKQELFLVKSKSMPSIHSAIATISKTSLVSVDECLQTSFAIDSSSSPVHEEESASDEKLDMVNQEVTLRYACHSSDAFSRCRFSLISKTNAVGPSESVFRNNRCMKSVRSFVDHVVDRSSSVVLFFRVAKIRHIDDTMLHRRLGTILSYVTDDFSVSVTHTGLHVHANHLFIYRRLSTIRAFLLFPMN